MPSFETGVINAIIQAIGIIISSALVFYARKLERMITFRDKLSHRAKIQGQVDPLLREIREDRRCKVELLNIKRCEVDRVF